VKPIVRLRFVNFFPGFTEALCRSHVLMDLANEFEFVFEGDPEILLVNCYGQQSIGETEAIKVGYYTENLAPDLVNYDYFFGCEYAPLIGNPRYCKRVYGPLSVHTFAACTDAKAVLAQKTEFCNFIYSSRVAHRERFYQALSAYRPIRAPGRSMNNCSDLNARSDDDWHAAKTAYLRKFKFTIAFENSRRAGYATEKLFDAFAADTVPIYWGDPELHNIVNKDAVIWVDGDWERDVMPWLRLPEAREPFRPYLRSPTVLNKLTGRFNDFAASLRGKRPYSRGFAAAIEEVRYLDNDGEAYCRKLSQPRVKRNEIIRIRDEYFAFRRKIIAHAHKRYGSKLFSPQQ
jgi:alpha(1,3/1,4) fucosyltransferase